MSDAPQALNGHPAIPQDAPTRDALVANRSQVLPRAVVPVFHVYDDDFVDACDRTNPLPISQTGSLTSKVHSDISCSTYLQHLLNNAPPMNAVYGSGLHSLSRGSIEET